MYVPDGEEDVGSPTSMLAVQRETPRKSAPPFLNYSSPTPEREAPPTQSPSTNQIKTSKKKLQLTKSQELFPKNSLDVSFPFPFSPLSPLFLLLSFTSSIGKKSLLISTFLPPLLPFTFLPSHRSLASIRCLDVRCVPSSLLPSSSSSPLIPQLETNFSPSPCFSPFFPSLSPIHPSPLASVRCNQVVREQHHTLQGWVRVQTTVCRIGAIRTRKRIRLYRCLQNTSLMIR